MERSKKIYQRIAKVQTEQGVYFFDKLVFQMGMLFIIFLLVCSALVLGFDLRNNFYVKCPNDSRSQCENPLFNNTAYCGSVIDDKSFICNTEFLPKGFSYGRPPPIIFDVFGDIALIVVILCFVTNHFAHNQGFFSKKKKIKRRKA